MDESVWREVGNVLAEMTLPMGERQRYPSVVAISTSALSSLCRIVYVCPKPAESVRPYYGGVSGAVAHFHGQDRVPLTVSLHQMSRMTGLRKQELARWWTAALFVRAAGRTIVRLVESGMVTIMHSALHVDQRQRYEGGGIYEELSKR